MKRLALAIIVTLYSTAMADSVVYRVSPVDPTRGTTLFSEDARPLLVLFEITHARSGDQSKFVVRARNTRGKWPHAIRASLGTLEIHRHEGEVRGWSFKHGTEVWPREQTDTTAVYVIVIPHRDVDNATFMFEQTYPMPSADIYEIKLSYWAE